MISLRVAPKGNFAKKNKLRIDVDIGGLTGDSLLLRGIEVREIIQNLKIHQHPDKRPEGNWLRKLLVL